VGNTINLINPKDLMPGDAFEGRWAGTGVRDWPNGKSLEIFTLETRNGPISLAITAAFKDLVAEARPTDFVRVVYRGTKALKSGRNPRCSWDCDIDEGGAPDQSDQDDDDSVPF